MHVAYRSLHSTVRSSSFWGIVRNSDWTWLNTNWLLPAGGPTHIMQANGSHVYFAITLHPQCNFSTRIFNNLFAQQPETPAPWSTAWGQHIGKKYGILSWKCWHLIPRHCLTNHQPIPVQLYGRSNSDTELMQTKAMAAEIPSPPACESILKISKPSPSSPITLRWIVCFVSLASLRQHAKSFLLSCSSILVQSSISRSTQTTCQWLIKAHISERTQVAAHSLPSAHQNVAIILQHTHVQISAYKINGNHACSSSMQATLHHPKNDVQSLVESHEAAKRGSQPWIWFCKQKLNERNLVAFSIYTRNECEFKTLSAKKEGLQNHGLLYIIESRHLAKCQKSDILEWRENSIWMEW